MKDPTKITLRCPQCGRTKTVARDDTDPPNTAEIEMVCDRHEGFDDVRYYDATGMQINPI